MKELKIRIENYKKIEKQLVAAGAVFSEEVAVVDTYYPQPVGLVLKVSETDKGNFLVRLQAKDGGFEIKEKQPLTDNEQTKKELVKKHEIKCVLKKKRRFFDFEENQISIELIEDVGEFLILTGENINKEMITNKLGLDNPQFITVSFDELIQKKKAL